MTTEVIDLGYQPRKQFYPFHQRKQRWGCIVAHRRAGKTVACIMDLVDEALRCTKSNPQFAYIAPHYVQAKDVAWSYLKDFTRRIPGTKHNESELKVTLPNGAIIRLYGADNYDRLRGLYFDGVILDEFADMDPRAWPEVIRPALSDRKGWAIFIGTPKGRNAFWELYELSKQNDDWFSLMLRASETGIVDDEELEDAQQTMSLEQYEQEYECSFEAAIVGAYYAREIANAESEGRVRLVEYQEGVPVQTAWDLGFGDATSIFFFQIIGGELRVIDHHEKQGANLQIHAAVVLGKPYEYSTHWLPHDARATFVDTGKSRVELLKGFGMETNGELRIVPDHKVMDGIEVAMVALRQTHFDMKTCHYALECLRQYRADYDEKLKTLKQKPLHDWTSHTADAFRYMAMAFKEAKDLQKPKYTSPDLRFEAMDDGTIISNKSVFDIVEAKRRKRERGLDRGR